MESEYELARITIPIVIRCSVQLGPEGMRGRANKGEHVDEHARARATSCAFSSGMKRGMILALVVGAPV